MLKNNSLIKQSIIIILCAVMILVTVLVTNAFFKSGDEAKVINVVGTVELQVDSNMQQISNIVFEPGEVYNLYTKFKCKQNAVDALVRIKFTGGVAAGAKVFNLDVVGLNSDPVAWIYDPIANYYYYCGIVNSENTVVFNETITTVNNLNNVKAGQKVECYLEIESIQSNYGAYLVVDGWKDAPEKWKQVVSKLV